MPGHVFTCAFIRIRLEFLRPVAGLLLTPTRCHGGREIAIGPGLDVDGRVPSSRQILMGDRLGAITSARNGN